MTDRLVTLTVWMLAAGFALACALFAWRASGAAVAPVVATDAAAGVGAARFATHCARCHETDEFTSRLAAPDRVAAAGRLLEELADHGDSAFADDLAIVHWLATQAGPATVPPAQNPKPAEEAEDDFSL